MSDNVTALPPAKPVEKKLRTITLTNRAPIKIAEDDWPVIAQGGCGFENAEHGFGWSITIKVRRSEWDYIVHATYRDYPPDEEDFQEVRVGHVISHQQAGAAADLWAHILAVGDELRERIKNDHLRKNVTFAIDACFANLPSQGW